jgi:hypothetical protein
LQWDRSLPSGVVGPVLLSALPQLASICLSELIKTLPEQLGSLSNRSHPRIIFAGIKKRFHQIKPNLTVEIKTSCLKAQIGELPPQVPICTCFYLEGGPGVNGWNDCRTQSSIITLVLASTTFPSSMKIEISVGGRPAG